MGEAQRIPQRRRKPAEPLPFLQAGRDVFAGTIRLQAEEAGKLRGKGIDRAPAFGEEKPEGRCRGIEHTQEAGGRVGDHHGPADHACRETCGTAGSGPLPGAAQQVRLQALASMLVTSRVVGAA